MEDETAVPDDNNQGQRKQKSRCAKNIYVSISIVVLIAIVSSQSLLAILHESIPSMLCISNV